MAHLTSFGGGYVSNALTNGNHPIMTTLATADDLRMIHQRTHRHPGRINVAGLAQIGSIDVRRALANRQRTIVTGDTGLRHRGMTKDCHSPVRRRVTGIAGSSRWDMRGALTAGNHPVMTTLATTDNLCVIHQWTDGRPGREHMTGLTNIRGVDMSSALARRGGAIVTGDTGVGNAGVVERCD